MDIYIRLAAEEDLPAILNLYAQPEMDDGRILALEQAKLLMELENKNGY